MTVVLLLAGMFLSVCLVLFVRLVVVEWRRDRVLDELFWPTYRHRRRL